MNKFQIFIDILRFKLKYKDVKKYQKMKDILDKFIYRTGKPIQMSVYAEFVKYSVKDYLDLIKFNNKYTNNNKDKINLHRFLQILEDEFHGYNSVIIIDLKKELLKLIPFVSSPEVVCLEKFGKILKNFNDENKKYYK